jgi:hypothetical protein
VIYLNAEDENAEVHRRLAAIAAHYGTSLHALKDDLHVLALAGQNKALGYPDRNGLIIATPLFHKLTEAVRDIQPKVDRPRHFGRHFRRQRERPCCVNRV